MGLFFGQICVASFLNVAQEESILDKNVQITWFHFHPRQIKSVIFIIWIEVFDERPIRSEMTNK